MVSFGDIKLIGTYELDLVRDIYTIKIENQTLALTTYQMHRWLKENEYEMVPRNRTIIKRGNGELALV